MDKEDMEALADKAGIAFEKANLELEGRYSECDRHGHKEEDEENNICEYCFRHLEYGTPKTDAKYSYRKGLSIWHQPLDVAVTSQERRDEIAQQKSLDRIMGIEKLMELKIV